MRSTCLTLALVLGTHAAAQVATGHHLVATRTAAGGTWLLDVDPVTGATRTLPGFSLDAYPPVACCWDPIARHAVVAVQTAGSCSLVRVDPRGSFERLIGALPDPVVAVELDEHSDLMVLTGGRNGGIWSIPRNGPAPILQMAAPHATALGAAKRSPIVWVAQAPPGVPPTIGFVDPRSTTWLVPPLAIPGLTGRRITGVYDLPTGAIRQVLTDDLGGVHLLEFATTLRTLPLSPPLPPGAAVDLMVDQATSIDAVVLGDARHPHLHRVPVFGGAPTVIRLAGPLPGDPVDFDLVDSAAGWSFGRDCGRAFGAKILLLPRGGNGTLEIRGAPRTAPALAVLGVSEQVHGGLGLPFALPGGCPLRVSANVVVPTMTSASGVGQLRFPVPAALPRGFALYAQWVFPDPTGATATSIALSDMIEP